MQIKTGFAVAAALALLLPVFLPMFSVAAAAQAEPSPAGTDDADDYEDDYEDDGQKVTVADPIEPFNREIFQFNDFMILYVLEPVAKVQKAVIPWEFRTIFRNMLRNIRFPVRFVNCLLQGKWEKSGDEFASFFLNTTVGFLGMADVAATYPGLDRSPEDMGQTFAVWGWEESSFLTLPFFGPSTFRDALGKLPDAVIDPLFWYSNLTLSLSLRGGEAVNDTSFRIGDYEAIKKASLDPYVAIRNGFIQNRNKLIAE
ncbi:MAG: VacJ family lipoprotein [Desulfobacterales bacterium]|nr:VacJ family lipoprotein [Desulfobacterales bacterium]